MNEAIHSAAASDIPPRDQTDCLSRIVLLLTWLWLAFITALRIGIEMLMSGFIGALPTWTFFLPSLSQVILLAVPLVPLAVFWRNRRHRGIYQAWALAAGVQLTIAPVHLFRPDAAQFAALYQIGVNLVWSMVILAVVFLRRNPDRPSWRAGDGAISEALLIAGLFMLPWAAWGALGSPLDILSQLGGGLAFGLLSALLMERFIFRFDPPGEVNQARGGWSSFLFKGFTCGTLLVLLAGGTTFPFAGMQLLLTICLPPLGWLLAVVAATGKKETGGSQSSLPALALLVGLCAAAPMLFIDADELPLAISLSAGETLSWGLKASAAAMLIGLVAGLAARLLQSTRPAQPQRGAASPWSRGGLAVGALISWLGVVLVFFSLGQPGLHGDGLFVILKSQADVSAAAQIEDYTQRRTFVYNTLVATANQSQADLRQAMDRLHIAYHPYYLINAIAVEGGPALRFWLSRRPEVDRVLNDPWLRPLPEQPPVHTGDLPMPTQPDWNLTLIGADQVWKDLGITGKGIVIGQSDSGVQWDHPELMGAYRGYEAAGGVVDHNYNWYDPWYGTRAPVDRGGHGTHTTGIIVGQHTGVAPGAAWYACANLARNLGNPSLYLDCMQFMLAPFPLDGDPFTDGDPGRGAHVLNNSWGCPEIEGCDAETFLTAMQALRAAGVFVVVSAGNDGPGCATLNSPLALYADAFSVGSINSAKQISIFSSIGPVTADGSGRIKPDIVAPGEAVLSSMPEATYAVESGTSMAGPHVVGVVALVWSANPQLIGDIEATEQILIHAAQPYQGSLPNCPGASQIPSTAYGYGIIDAYQAVRQALDLKGSLP